MDALCGRMFAGARFRQHQDGYVAPRANSRIIISTGPMLALTPSTNFNSAGPVHEPAPLPLPSLSFALDANSNGDQTILLPFRHYSRCPLKNISEGYWEHEGCHQHPKRRETDWSTILLIFQWLIVNV